MRTCEWCQEPAPDPYVDDEGRVFCSYDCGIRAFEEETIEGDVWDRI